MIAGMAAAVAQVPDYERPPSPLVVPSMPGPSPSVALPPMPPPAWPLPSPLAVEDAVAAGVTRSPALREAVAEVEALIATEKARRGQLVGKVPAGLLRRYDSIREKRLGVGLVPAAEGGCSGCNMKLPPQLYNILQRADTIEQCPSCQRIVFWEGIVAPGESQKAGNVEARA